MHKKVKFGVISNIDNNFSILDKVVDTVTDFKVAKDRFKRNVRSEYEGRKQQVRDYIIDKKCQIDASISRARAKDHRDNFYTSDDPLGEGEGYIKERANLLGHQARLYYKLMTIKERIRLLKLYGGHEDEIRKLIKEYNEVNNRMKSYNV